MVWGRDVMDFFCHTKYIERESSVQVALAARELVAGRNSNREKLLFCSVLFFSSHFLFSISTFFVFVSFVVTVQTVF